MQGSYIPLNLVPAKLYRDKIADLRKKERETDRQTDRDRQTDKERKRKKQGNL